LGKDEDEGGFESMLSTGANIDSIAEVEPL
jgi:hypothetical protein